MADQYVLVPSPDATVSFILTGGTPPPVQYECQVTSAAVSMTPNTTTVPATGCAGPQTRNLPPTYALALNFLQDWGDPNSLSQFLWDNQLEDADFIVSLGADPVPVASGTCQLVPGNYGGDFANPLTATASMPIVAKPAIGPAAAVLHGGETAESEAPYDTAGV
jgi:hypothetical protein